VKTGFLTIFLVLLSIASVSLAEDNTCVQYDPTTGETIWDGYRCAVDANGDGVINDCTEMYACIKPSSGGVCERSAEPAAWKCLTTGLYFLDYGSPTYGLTRCSDPSSGCNPDEYCMPPVPFPMYPTAAETCYNWDPGTRLGCQDMTCTDVYLYTCSIDGSQHLTLGACQAVCGEQCQCESPSFYDINLGLCLVDSANPCPSNYHYDSTAGLCVVDIECPPGSTINHDTKQCESDVSFVCPDGFIYNSSNGRCQKIPDCPAGSFYNPVTDRCELVSCPEDFTFDYEQWRCEQPVRCTSGGSFNPDTAVCEINMGVCNPQDPTDLNPDYVKHNAGLSQVGEPSSTSTTGCTSCAACYSNPAAAEVASPPPGYICMGHNEENYRALGAYPDYPCAYDWMNYYGKPYVCSRTGNADDLKACLTSCPCPLDYNPDTLNQLCTKDPCQGTGTVDPSEAVCWLQPATWSGGTCPTGYMDRNGRCEATPTCDPPGTYNPDTNKCKEPGNAVCPEGYTPSGQICVADIPCTSVTGGAAWNPTRDRCEQLQAGYCDPGYVYDPSNGRCEYDFTCPYGSWNTYLQTCYTNDSQLHEACQAPYSWSDLYSACRKNRFECPDGGVYIGALSACLDQTQHDPCPQGYGWGGLTEAFCKSPQIICPDGFTYMPEWKFWIWYDAYDWADGGCFSNDQSLRDPCIAPYTWNGNVCATTDHECPENTVWRTQEDACYDNSTRLPCEAPYSWDESYQRCRLSISTTPESVQCPLGSMYDRSAGACVNTVSNDCATYGFTWNATRGRCEKDPFCDLEGIYNTATDLCEINGVVQCPTGYNWNPPYCEVSASSLCPSPSTYNTSTNRCELSTALYCPMGPYDCSTGDCTATAVCDIVPVVVTITSNDLLLYTVTGFSASGNTMIFTRTDGSQVTVDMTECEAAGSANITGADSFSAHGNVIEFFDGNASLLGTLTISNCTVSGTGSGGILGPRTYGVDVIDFANGIITFTPNTTEKTVCPLDDQATCTNDPTPTCTVSQACQPGCPQGYTLESGTCYQEVDCPPGGTLNTIREMCQVNYAGEIICPEGTTPNYTTGMCEFPAVCSLSTLDTANDICYWQNTQCPDGWVFCAAGTSCRLQVPINTDPGTTLLYTTIAYTDGCYRMSVDYCPKSDNFYKYFLGYGITCDAWPIYYCPQDFAYCEKYQYCKIPGLGTVRAYSSGCYNRDVANCYPHGTNTTWMDRNYCYARPDWHCPPGFVWCGMYSYCTIPELGQRWIEDEGCWSHTEARCPEATSFVDTWVDNNQCYGRPNWTCGPEWTYCLQRTYCDVPGVGNRYTYDYEGCQQAPTEVCPQDPAVYFEYYTSGADCVARPYWYCPQNHQFCRRYQWCSFPSGAQTYTGQYEGCMYDRGIIASTLCPTASKPVAVLNQYPPQCYEESGCATSSGYQLEPSTQTCWGGPLPCPPGGSIDYNLDKCTSAPDSIQCAPGYTWNPQASACQKDPACPEAVSPSTGAAIPSLFDTFNDVCWVCPDGFIHDPGSGTCIADPYCPEGTYHDPVMDVCFTDAAIICPDGAYYDAVSGKCITPIVCPQPDCSPGCFDPIARDCNAALSPPCQEVDTYNQLLDMCTVPGTAPCPEGFTYVEQERMCAKAPECTPSDWVCPTDTDPRCQENSPYNNKKYLLIDQYTTYTYATTTSRMTRAEYVDITQSPVYPANMATLADRQRILDFYCSGTFWIQEGVLYNNVFFDVDNCYNYQSFDGSVWQPNDYVMTDNGLAGTRPACANLFRWERISQECLCKTFKVDTYTRACQGTSYVETHTGTTYTNSDISTCNADPTPYCWPGVSQDGLNECTYSREEFAGSITCGTTTVPETRKVTVCDSTMDVIVPVEEITIPNLNRGVVWWNYRICNPCLYEDMGTVDDDVESGQEPPIDYAHACTEFWSFSGVDRRCRKSSLTTLFADCCGLSGWFKSWCSQEEMELKKKKQAGTCHQVGTYCAKRLKIVGVCIKRKKTYCCFNSKLSRIINVQGRAQIGKGWGSPKYPDCKGFKPEELNKLDFSRMDLSEYIADIEAQTATAPVEAQQKVLEQIPSIMTEGANKELNQPFGEPEY
jgi:hypothetical protein